MAHTVGIVICYPLKMLRHSSKLFYAVVQLITLHKYVTCIQSWCRVFSAELFEKYVTLIT